LHLEFPFYRTACSRPRACKSVSWGVEWWRSRKLFIRQMEDFCRQASATSAEKPSAMMDDGCLSIDIGAGGRTSHPNPLSFGGSSCMLCSVPDLILFFPGAESLWGSAAVAGSSFSLKSSFAATGTYKLRTGGSPGLEPPLDETTSPFAHFAALIRSFGAG
jgi:hypothetical protein